MNLQDNVLFVLIPKKDVEYLFDDFSIRQALEKMEFHRYTMIPVIERSSGRYCYSLREGDVLWFLKDHHLPWNQTEKEKIASIPLSRDIVAVKVSASLEDLQPLIISQNYVPVTDDNGIFIGIVTRKAVMNALLKKD
jgi:CBS-domain-containing membrane protein